MVSGGKPVEETWKEVLRDRRKSITLSWEPKEVSNCRTVDDLPKEALEYIRYIEKVIECPIKYVSVGAERDAYITMF